ncbi:type 1 glutamine amidotransferase domain-containing protein [Aquimarina gracilis]|uniref:Type 1 glutamine amidotransferase domain-containing protein n=1 Tax=Aquimarina gracilis TaxID=874422 RepID=A0ABU5ZWI8_9FLAO|nr:type 1 glutamine amidotransferase domain-containing protein [Aquimarina gracilis]MEB3346218.1 type 1 glutamine amidotransferase domain-containing protein [Aquimarina gracilis]
MNKLFGLLILLFLSISCTKNNKRNKILFITTNIDQIKNEPNGTYLIELAVPFYQFLKESLDVDIVSPKGGKIPIYHNADTSSIVKSVIQSAAFKSKTENSLKPTEIDFEDYSAIIIPGGYGQFWDTHKDKNILNIISKVYESGGVIGTIGHGTATLIDVKLKSGKYLVKNKTMTCFPTWNEKNIMEQSDFGKLLPYDMEMELLKRGANLKVYDHQKRINYEVVDSINRLITASFANSGKFVADEVIKLINAQK